MKIGISYDHNGYEVGQQLKKYLTNKGYEVKDYNNVYNKDDDYPVEALKLCNDIKLFDFGVLICGSGVGMSMIANKVKNIRCARVVNKEEAIETRLHQNANVIALSSKTPNIEEVLDAFINTEYIYEERHQRRIDQIKSYENME